MGVQLARYAGPAGAQKRCPGLTIQLHVVFTFLERGIAVQGVERLGQGEWIVWGLPRQRSRRHA